MKRTLKLISFSSIFFSVFLLWGCSEQENTANAVKKDGTKQTQSINKIENEEDEVNY